MIEDIKGNIHFARVDGYKMTISDERESGEPVVFEDIEDITKFNETFVLYGKATIEVEFTGELDGSATQFYSYYTVETPRGGQEVAFDEKDIQVIVDNQQFSLVTFDSSVVDEEKQGEGYIDVDMYNTTISQVDQDHSYNFGVTASTNNHINGSGLHAYRYINNNAKVDVVMHTGESTSFDIAHFEPRKHYDFQTIKVDPNNGNIIITPPDFGEPIVIVPTPDNAVITPDQVVGAYPVSYDKQSGSPTYETIEQIKRDGSVTYDASIYPNFKFTKDSGLLLKDFIWVAEIETSKEYQSIHGVPWFSIYLVNPEPTLKEPYIRWDVKIDGSGIFNPDGRQVSSIEEFISEYGEYELYSNSDNGRTNTNFIIRLGLDEAEKFTYTVSKFEVYTNGTVPAINDSQLFYADIFSIDLDGAVVIKGKHEPSVGDLKYNTIAVPSIKFDGTKTLDQYDVNSHSISVDEVNVISDNGVEEIFVKIYLTAPDGTEVKYNWFLNGDETRKGRVVNHDYPSDYFEDFDAFYLERSDYIVRNWWDTLPKQNFIIQFGDTNHDAEDSMWKINRFDVKEITVE